MGAFPNRKHQRDRWCLPPPQGLGDSLLGAGGAVSSQMVLLGWKEFGPRSAVKGWLGRPREKGLPWKSSNHYVLSWLKPSLNGKSWWKEENKLGKNQINFGEACTYCCYKSMHSLLRTIRWHDSIDHLMLTGTVHTDSGKPFCVLVLLTHLLKYQRLANKNTCSFKD